MAESPEPQKKTVSMRHSKLTAKEAALLTGELNKPSWQSRNEGIHERVSFEDTIWGFDLAGGLFYKTPLRVTMVKTDSRADKAGIRPGDMLLRINDIDTSTLTIQEAHEIILESGVYLKLAVTAPDDEEDSYFCWEDQIEDGYDSEEERRKQVVVKPKKEIVYKVSSYWSLQWPWVSKRRVIYRESNCFMVNSKYESKHRDKFPLQTNFGPKVLEDVVLHSKKDDNNVENPTPLQTDNVSNDVKANNVNADNVHQQPDENKAELENKIQLQNGAELENTNQLQNGVIEQDKKPDVVNTKQEVEEKIVPKEGIASLLTETELTSTSNENLEDSYANGINDDEEDTEESEDKASIVEGNGVDNEDVEKDNSEKNEDVSEDVDDDVINQVLEKGDEVNKEDEDNIFNGILSDSNVRNSEAIDENER